MGGPALPGYIILYVEQLEDVPLSCSWTSLCQWMATGVCDALLVSGQRTCPHGVLKNELLWEALSPSTQSILQWGPLGLLSVVEILLGTEDTTKSL